MSKQPAPSDQAAFPPAAALPSEPMELDETQETGEGNDTDMRDAGTEVDVSRPHNTVPPRSATTTKAAPPPPSAKGKGKAKARDQGAEAHMAALQDVAKDPRHLAQGLEALGQETFNGKSLTDPIKSVTVRPSPPRLP